MEALGQETLYWISQDTLRRIGENDDTLIELGICNKENVLRDGRLFSSGDRDQYSQLGSCIGMNTQCKNCMSNLKILCYL